MKKGETRGRKPLPQGKAKEKRLSIRVTEAEFERLSRESTAAGHSKLSDHIRHKLLGK